MGPCSETGVSPQPPWTCAWGGADSGIMDEGADRKGRRPTGSSSSCLSAAVRPVHWTGCPLPGIPHLGKGVASWALQRPSKENARSPKEHTRAGYLLWLASVVFWRSKFSFCAGRSRQPPALSLSGSWCPSFGQTAQKEKVDDTACAERYRRVKILPMSFVLDASRKFSPGDQPPTGYGEWHEWAKAQHGTGLRQRRCPSCLLWKFPQEVCGCAGKKSTGEEVIAGAGA